LAVRAQAGDIYERRLDDPSRAMEHFMAVFVEQPSRVDLRDRLQSLSEATGNWAGLAEALNRGVTTVTDEGLRVGHLVVLAQVQEERLNDASGAIATLERALVIDERDPAILSGLRRLYGAADHKVGVLDATLRLADLKASASESLALYREGLALGSALGDETAEIHACEAILRREPQNEEVADLLADRYESAERYEELASLLEQGVERPDDPRESAARHLRLASIRAEKLLDVEAALVHYAEAWDRDGLQRAAQLERALWAPARASDAFGGEPGGRAGLAPVGLTG
jgi:tetratricopeptide (TPR) repeat protein